MDLAVAGSNPVDHPTFLLIVHGGGGDDEDDDRSGSEDIGSPVVSFAADREFSVLGFNLKVATLHSTQLLDRMVWVNTVFVPYRSSRSGLLDIAS